MESATRAFTTGKLSTRIKAQKTRTLRNSPEDGQKFNALLEAAALPEEKLGRWLREKGLRSEHLEVWQEEMKKELDQQKKNQELKEAKKRIKELERELNRKDKALAEMTALVVLKKKLDALYGNGDEGK